MSENLSIQSQANTTSGSGITSAGMMTIGDLVDWYGAAAIRFELPEDWSGSETVHEATLTLLARGQGGSGSWIVANVGVLDSGSQVLPGNYVGVSSATMRSEGRATVGAYSPPGGVDHNLDGTYAAINIDVIDAVAAAVAAGQTDGGFVVILLQYHNSNGTVHLEIDGIGNTTPPSLYLDYSEPGPPGPGSGNRSRRLFPCRLFPSRLFSS